MIPLKLAFNSKYNTMNEQSLTSFELYRMAIVLIFRCKTALNNFTILIELLDGRIFNVGGND